MKKRAIAVAFLLILVCGVSGVKGPLVPSGSVLLLDLGGDIKETATWNPVMSLFTEPPLIVLDKLVILDEAAKDKRLKAVVVRISDVNYGMGKAQEFREAILRFREKSGKPIFAYLELEGGGNLEYFIATACDKVYVAPASMLGLTGLSSFRFYLGGLWEKLYLDMQVDRIAEFKSAADMLDRRDMSPAEREMLNSILDSLYQEFIKGIAQARKVSEEKAREWVDAAWLIPDRYEEAGAIDGVAYLEEVAARAAGKPEFNLVTDREYFREIPRSARTKSKPRVAVVFAAGPIVAGKGPDLPAGGFELMTSDQMVKRLKKVMEDRSIDGVIFRVDSGGGSALGSDLIWRAIKELKRKKPVVVSMSDVAGSGGYYISCAAHKIVAQPGTITGSIGILTARLSIGRLLEKLQIGTEMIGRGRFATMGRIDRRADEEELRKTHETIAALYELFLSRVAEGRGMKKEEVNEIGRGRVWTGEQGVEVGLVDRTGGFHEALEEMKRLLGAREDQEVQLVYGPEKVTLWKLLIGKVETALFRMVLSPEEQALIKTIRGRGMWLWKPGTPLALTRDFSFAR